MLTETATSEALYQYAVAYQRRFDKTLQENQKCAQHHIHKKDPKTGKRHIPNACQPYRARRNASATSRRSTE